MGRAVVTLSELWFWHTPQGRPTHLGACLPVSPTPPCTALYPQTPQAALEHPPSLQVHDPASAGGSVGLGAHLGADLAGLTVEGAAFSMIDGGAYDPDKAYKVRAARV